MFYIFWALYIIVLVNAQNSFSLGLLLVLTKKTQPYREVEPENISKLFGISDSLHKRIHSLEINGLLKISSDQKYYELTSRGIILAKVALFLRRIFYITDVG